MNLAFARYGVERSAAHADALTQALARADACTRSPPMRDQMAVLHKDVDRVKAESAAPGAKK
ncbi:MAG TPA: hypothetical protein VJ724_04510 [Tahibacter sp.]|nr:hypothetical protein [Tahibacter sp.]